MPYLGKPFNKITTFGKVTEGTWDEKNNSNQWKKHSVVVPADRLRFGLTHPDQILSQVREKTQTHITMKMSNLYSNADKIPTKKGIFTFGKPSDSGPQFPNYPGQFHTQSPQILDRHGSRLDQARKDDNL